jgi:hypothetical protein
LHLALLRLRQRPTDTSLYDQSPCQRPRGWYMQPLLTLTLFIQDHPSSGVWNLKAFLSCSYPSSRDVHRPGWRDSLFLTSPSHPTRNGLISGNWLIVTHSFEPWSIPEEIQRNAARYHNFDYISGMAGLSSHHHPS